MSRGGERVGPHTAPAHHTGCGFSLFGFLARQEHTRVLAKLGDCRRAQDVGFALGGAVRSYWDSGDRKVAICQLPGAAVSD